MTNTTIYTTPETKATIIKTIESQKARSCWMKGVKNYAINLIDKVDEGAPINELTLLNGADDWSAYSYGGSALIYDYDIAKTLCTPSELKKTGNGFKQPNNRETWLDVQARALYQAAELIINTVNSLIL